jgi:hypothetical protein
VDFFDDCSCETFSLLWIEEFLRHLGYDMDGRLHIYWCKPGMEISNGLQCIQCDCDIVDMIEATKVDKTLSLMIDHTNFLRRLRPDVPENGGARVPPVTMEACRAKCTTCDKDKGSYC